MPGAIEEGRVEIKTIDFFKDSPLKDCDVYYVSNLNIFWKCIDYL